MFTKNIQARRSSERFVLVGLVWRHLTLEIIVSTQLNIRHVQMKLS